MPDLPLFQPATLGPRGPERAASEVPTPARVRSLPVIPERYSLREKEGVRFLECDEAPRLRAILEPGMSVSRAEAVALGKRTILLDGAGSFGPLIDNDRQLYNLDHHAGCERLFTLSTCEQALLMVHGGLELSEGDWTLYANEPDLDTVLALWCLLNHRRLRELRPEARDVLLPLVRLEGAIDANGPDLAALCGLPVDVLERTRQRIDDLLAVERGLKQAGSWESKDRYEYTLEMLRAIDCLVYRREDFGDYARIEEIYGHAEVAPRRVAVACRDRSGIYMVEQHLKERWGEQLCLIALENQPGQYTLRRVRSIAGPQLDPAYDLLNKVDPAVDGRPPGKGWGGSAEIGGSPRGEGTRLSAEEVLDTLARAYRTTTFLQRTRATVVPLVLGLSFALFWPAAAGLLALASSDAFSLSPSAAAARELSLAALMALAVGALVTRIVSHRRPWVFGWRLPANGGGWWLAPLLLLGAAPAAAWAFPWLGAGSMAFPPVLAAGALALVATEVWYRGLVHGLLVLDFPVQRPKGSWRISRAAWISALSYAAVVTPVLFGLAHWALAAYGVRPLEAVAGFAALSLAVGLGLAVVRERSLSLLPGLALQVAALLGWAAGAHLVP